jgi:hypothetical protein
MTLSKLRTTLTNLGSTLDPTRRLGVHPGFALYMRIHQSVFEPCKWCTPDPCEGDQIHKNTLKYTEEYTRVHVKLRRVRVYPSCSLAQIWLKSSKYTTGVASALTSKPLMLTK